MTNNNWCETSKLIARFFGTTVELIDHIAVYEVLEMCLFGKSNQHISDKLDLHVNCVEEILFEYLNFIGFTETLEISPIIVFEKYQNQDTFSGAMFCYSDFDDQMITKLFNGCVRLKEMKKEIDRYYAKQ